MTTVEATAAVVSGRYRLVEKAGAGGMAVVWRGFDEVLGRRVAVKVLHQGLATDETVIHQLLREAQAAASLSHPGVAEVYDFGRDIGPDGNVRAYVVMELLDGVSLRSRLTNGAALPWPQASLIAANVADALAAAHARGIVHRDVSPSNIMLTAGRVKVLDFGLAALQGECDDDELFGTPAFIAPERLAEPRLITPAIDVYSLGVVLYRMLVGALPWSVHSAEELIEHHRWTPPTPLPAIDGLPPEVPLLCMRCLSKDPAHRPTSAAVARGLRDVTPPEVLVVGDATAEGDGEATRFIAGLAGTGTSSVNQASDESRRPPVRRKGVVAAAAGAIALAIGGVSLSLLMDVGSARPVAEPVPDVTRTSAALVPAGGLSPSAASSAPAASATPLIFLANPSESAVPPGASAPSGPTSAVPAPSASSPTTAPPGQTFTAQGGSVQVMCVGDRATVLGVTVAPGFSIKDLVPGPAAEVRVVLKSPIHESEIRVKCPQGSPVPEIREKP